MRITVTKEDIKTGNRRNVESCPIAQAIKRKGYELIQVGYSTVHVRRNQDSVTELYMHSKRSTKFMFDFDTETFVEPSTFILKPFKEVF